MPYSSAVSICSVSHRYGKTKALLDASVDIPSGEMVGLIGPDGVGKSTLMGLVAGAKVIQSGQIKVLGGDMRSKSHRDQITPSIAYMPQGLGKNLYAELSVYENLDFFGRLFTQSANERKDRIARLLDATGLAPFPDRPAGKLSGGMKQKLGLCCALIHDPELLLLDEPTTGVDPLSRQQFWNLIDQIREQRPTMSVLVSTAYMDEADRFDWLIAMHAGKVLATGSPNALREQTNTDNLEAAFVELLPAEARGESRRLEIPRREPSGGVPAIHAEGLTRRFGSFIAVDDVSFKIDRGEIFGFLGSNGCGKTTTMKMLTGLLPASEGHAELFGNSIDAGSLEIRRRVGYMSQSFSLYSELTVGQNLWLHARLFHLPLKQRRPRIRELLRQFGLEHCVDQLAAKLPLGVRQRLSLAVAIIHQPEMLILDEPTSGVDPVARDRFWELLVKLSREDRVTIFVSTHFMNEALRCDRISLMHASRVLACDEPRKLIQMKNRDSLEEAFIDFIREAEQSIHEANSAASGDEHDVAPNPSEAKTPEQSRIELVAETATATKRSVATSFFRPARMMAYSHRETLEILRDPVRLGFAFVGSILLMFVFGFGITMDVNQINFAVFDLDQTPASAQYVDAFVGSSYFHRKTAIYGPDDLEKRLVENDISLALEIPPDFGRDLKRGSLPVVAAWIDGSNPSRAATIEGYVSGVHASLLDQLQAEAGQRQRGRPSLAIEQRFRYNPTFESIYAMVPSVPAILLVLIPAILMAVSVVKEKELGSITNFYVTPTSRLEFLLGKQLPYIGIGLVNFAILTLMAIFLFDVPLKGSLTMLVACAAAYVSAVTSIGLLISSFTSSQVAAVFVTTIVTVLPSVQFSGLMQPVSTLEGGARWMGTFWPTTYYMHASVGAFTKGLEASELAGDLLALMAFTPVLTVLTALLLRKQEK